MKFNNNLLRYNFYNVVNRTLNNTPNILYNLSNIKFINLTNIFYNVSNITFINLTNHTNKLSLLTSINEEVNDNSDNTNILKYCIFALIVIMIYFFCKCHFERVNKKLELEKVAKQLDPELRMKSIMENV